MNQFGATAGHGVKATGLPSGAASGALSSWRLRGVVLIVVSGLTILIWLAAKTYTDAPPIPNKVVTPSGDVLFTGDDIVGGQQVFLRQGLMENGTIWGQGAYLGPDFSAEYLDTLADDVGQTIAQQRYSAILSGLDPAQRSGVIRTGYSRGAGIVRNDSIPAPKGFDPAMAGKRAEYDGGGPIEGTRFAGRPEFTGTLTGDYEFVNKSAIADFGVRKLNEIKGQILRKSIFSQTLRRSRRTGLALAPDDRSGT